MLTNMLESLRMDNRKAYSIGEFCQQHGIARSTYYTLPATQRPAEIHLGRRRLITEEAAAEWRQRLTQKSQ
jgi:phage-related protein